MKCTDNGDVSLIRAFTPSIIVYLCIFFVLQLWKPAEKYI